LAKQGSRHEHEAFLYGAFRAAICTGFAMRTL
jgi:hypothetical protein